MKEVLQNINLKMEELELNYEFGQMTKSPPKYPYWVGEYTEPESDTEDGLEKPTIILTGFARGKFLEIEEEKEKIKDHFKHGVSVVTESGAVMVIFYSSSYPVPTGEPDLKKIQVNLQIKIWKGN